MGLLSNAKSCENDYIDFLSFIYKLSEQEQESIRDIAIYLQKMGLLDKVNYYSTDGKWNYFSITDEAGKEYTNNIIHIICNGFNYSHFIYRKGQYLEFALEQAISSHYNDRGMPLILLKRQELMNIDELKDHVRFLDNTNTTPTTNTPTPANNDELATLQTQLDQAHARIAELERQLNDQPTTNPVTNITQEMQIINEVYGKFWENHKSNEIPPKKETIVSWIKSEYGISDRIAQAIDTIVRPEQYRTGGQKAR